MPPLAPARQLTLAAAAIGLILLGLLPRAAEDESQSALRAGAALIVVGLALDLHARVAGVLAARAERGGPGWVWACALAGSPAAVLHALARADGRPRFDTPLLAAVLATATALAVLFAVAGDTR